MNRKRSLAFLQLSRAAICPECGARPFELCRRIANDPSTRTRFVHAARLERVVRKGPALVRVHKRATARLKAGRELKAA